MTSDLLSDVFREFIVRIERLEEENRQLKNQILLLKHSIPIEEEKHIHFVGFTRKESQVLEIFLHTTKNIVTKEEIFKGIYFGDSRKVYPDKKIVHNYIKRVRDRLPEWIEFRSERSLGFRITPQEKEYLISLEKDIYVSTKI